MAFTLRVDTPWTYISASALTSAFSDRWYRSNSSVEKRPSRSRGTRSSSFPNPRHQSPTVVPRPIAQAPRRPFAGPGPEGLGHVSLQHLLERFLHEPFQELAVLADEGFDAGGLRATLGPEWSWSESFVSEVDLGNQPLAMTARLSQAVLHTLRDTTGDQSITADSGGYQVLITWAETQGRIEAFGIEGTGIYGAGVKGGPKLDHGGGEKPDHPAGGRRAESGCTASGVAGEASGRRSGSVVAGVLTVCETTAVAVQLQDVDVIRFRSS